MEKRFDIESDYSARRYMVGTKSPYAYGTYVHALMDALCIHGLARDRHGGDQCETKSAEARPE